MILDDSGAGHLADLLPVICSWHLELYLCADLMASVVPRAVPCTPTAGATHPQSLVSCLSQVEGPVGATLRASEELSNGAGRGPVVRPAGTQTSEGGAKT